MHKTVLCLLAGWAMLFLGLWCLSPSGIRLVLGVLLVVFGCDTTFTSKLVTATAPLYDRIAKLETLLTKAHNETNT